jgi:hypothetical protein
MGGARDAHEGVVINAHKILAMRTKENRPLGRHRHEFEDNIEMDLK